MSYRLRENLKRLLGRDIAGRDFAVFPDDTFIVSYPRSGNTWTRFLVASLVFPNQEVSFATLENQVPDAEAQSRTQLRHAKRPRFIKSHQYFHPRYRKVVYIVRDPRDVCLSYYDFQRKYRHIDDAYPFASYVNDFVSGRMLSASWGTWRENTASWIYARAGTPDFLLLRYEDMTADTRSQAARLAEFLGTDSSPAILERAIAQSDADRMRTLEKTQSGEWVSTKGKRSDILFVRTANAGGWKNQLPENLVASIESAWGPLMAALGYELVTRAEPDSKHAGSEFGFGIPLPVHKLASERRG